MAKDLSPYAASYTVWIIGRLAEDGEATYRSPRGHLNARSRVYNAARKMGVRVTVTRVDDNTVSARVLPNPFTSGHPTR